MDSHKIFEMLLQQFLVINENKDRLIAKATSAVQAMGIIDAWQQANLNQLTAGNTLLLSNTPELVALVTEVKDAGQQMEKALKELKSTAATLAKVNAAIGLIAQAVSLGTKLVSGGVV